MYGLEVPAKEYAWQSVGVHLLPFYMKRIADLAVNVLQGSSRLLRRASMRELSPTFI